MSLTTLLGEEGKKDTTSKFQGIFLALRRGKDEDFCFFFNEWETYETASSFCCF
jgi:hypothetical protein